MRKNITYVSVFLLVLGSFFISKLKHHRITNEAILTSNEKEYSSKNLINDYNAKHENKLKKENKRKEFYERFNQPYGEITPVEIQRKITDEVENATREQDITLPVSSWSCIGPYGLSLNYIGGQNNQYYSGRINDIEIDNGFGLRVGASTGGLFNLYNPISDNIPSAEIGSFATSPGNPATIIVGTGGAIHPGGTGLYKTTNTGLNWVSVGPSVFANSYIVYRLRYTPGNSNIVHCVTNDGYFRSNNGGDTWIKKYPVGGSAFISDIVINPISTNIIYIGRRGDGVYRSSDGGDNFIKLTTGGIPFSEIGRISLSICNSFPNNVYALMAKGTDYNKYMGVWRTTNDGSTWNQIGPLSLPASDDRQADIHNTIGVCPSDPNIILFGTVPLFRTTDGGTSWNNITYTSSGRVHPDNIIIRWANSGSIVWVGTDGGAHVSNNYGATFTSNLNVFPVTQFYNVDVGRSNTNIMIGGTQDNAVPMTTNGGFTWIYTNGGDGGDVAIDPFNATNWYSTTWGVGNFKHKSTNLGLNWIPLNSGFNTSSPGMSFETDGIAPVWLYTHNGFNVLRCTPPYTSWISMTPTPFLYPVRNGALESYTGSGGIAVYAPLYSTDASHKLKYFGGGSWLERSSGLPLSTRDIGTVSAHPTNVQKVYSLISGTGLPGQKVYKSTNNGFNWINVTGDLPDVQLTDLVAHPIDDNKLYLGTFRGFFRTTNGGANWHRWNNGFPRGVSVAELKYIDSIASRGKFYIVAATHGRSVWVREVSGDDPVGIVNNNIPVKFELGQNYPNPFNPSTLISFSLPAAENVELKVYDALGKEVASLINSRMEPGKHSVKFDGASMSSGVYFYKINAGRFTETKKMILIK